MKRHYRLKLILFDYRLVTCFDVETNYPSLLSFSFNLLNVFDIHVHILVLAKLFSIGSVYFHLCGSIFYCNLPYV